MKLGVVTLWTNGRQEAPLPERRSRSSVRRPTDVLDPAAAKPLFTLRVGEAIEGAPVLSDSDAAFDLASLPLPTATKKRSRKRAPRSNRGRAA